MRAPGFEPGPLCPQDILCSYHLQALRLTSMFCSTLSPGLGPPPWLWLLAAPPLSLRNGDGGHMGPQPRSRGKSLRPGQESYFWENPPSEPLDGRAEQLREAQLFIRAGDTPLHPPTRGRRHRGSTALPPPWSPFPLSSLHLAAPTSTGPAPTPGAFSDYSRPGQEPLCPHHGLDVPITALIPRG